MKVITQESVSEISDLLDVHEMLNKESDETIAESLEHIRATLKTLKDLTGHEEERVESMASMFLNRVRFLGYREGFNDAVKQMKAVILKTKTRRENESHSSNR